jgi:hypothetical protein
MSVLHFADLSGLHRYARSSTTHRAGWEWWSEMGSGVDLVIIGPEVYDIPEHDDKGKVLKVMEV